jgi:hypothetical protein
MTLFKSGSFSSFMREKIRKIYHLICFTTCIYGAWLFFLRLRETNQFRVTLKVGPGDGVTFNLTYQEILERRLGYYDHVLYIDPGQAVDDMRVDVSIEENRDITYLHVPPIRRPGLLTTHEFTG